MQAPRVKKRIDPTFPTDLEGKRYSLGVLILAAVIDESGKTRDVRALNHQDSHRTAAYVAAVKQWEYEPGTLNGKPLPVIFNLTVGHFPYEPTPE